jgi:hypothetical protein
VDRRIFLQATLGFVASPILAIEEAEAATKIIESPTLRKSQPDWMNREGQCPHNFEEGNFYLAQDESGATQLLGKEVRLRIISFRERVERICKNPFSRFVSYDTKSNEFKQIMEYAKKFMHAPMARKVEDGVPLNYDGKGVCMWGIEAAIQIEGVEQECRWGLAGRKGLATVLNVPKNETLVVTLAKVPLGSDRHIYNYAIHDDKGEVVIPAVISIFHTNLL